jgi:hypothetical protein
LRGRLQYLKAIGIGIILMISVYAGPDSLTGQNKGNVNDPIIVSGNPNTQIGYGINEDFKLVVIWVRRFPEAFGWSHSQDCLVTSSHF